MHVFCFLVWREHEYFSEQYTCLLWSLGHKTNAPTVPQHSRFACFRTLFGQNGFWNVAQKVNGARSSTAVWKRSMWQARIEQDQRSRGTRNPDCTCSQLLVRLGSEQIPVMKQNDKHIYDLFLQSKANARKNCTIHTFRLAQGPLSIVGWVSTSVTTNLDQMWEHTETRRLQDGCLSN